MEQFSLLLGVALSPWAFETMGYTGCFIFRAVGNFMSIMYLGNSLIDKPKVVFRESD